MPLFWRAAETVTEGGLLACRNFRQPGPFWGRQYIFWHDGRPLTLIYEVFSPVLQQLLGPSEHP